ncbi:MAG: hypothetical protein BRD57_06005 [Proteobacteria bacterium SW_6_67_9]|nr:MAG: hypothetical protein BRD57_06005 [Proteobacteria bacterium SW_6_67_9]
MEFVYLVGAIVILIAVTVVPVMIAAKWARARRSGFLEALAAVVLATLAVQVVIVAGLLALGLQWPGTAAIGPAL